MDRYYGGSIYYCLTSAPIWSLRIGWDMAGHARNWPISRPSSELAARMAVIGCQARRSSRFLETKAGPIAADFFVKLTHNIESNIHKLLGIPGSVLVSLVTSLLRFK